MHFIRSPFVKNLYDLKVNIVIKTLITSYVIVLAGWGMITPIIAVFITEKIPQATIETVGLAMSLYALTRSIVQLPIARFLDLKRGERDEFYSLFFGYLIIGVAAFLYSKVETIKVLYFVQFIYGIGDALLYPAWGALFMKHIDKRSEATESSLYQTSADITTAISASLGAFLVGAFGYQTVFSIVCAITLAACLTLIPLYKELAK